MGSVWRRGRFGEKELSLGGGRRKSGVRKTEHDAKNKNLEQKGEVQWR